jgi:hypothetical protein
MVHDHAHPMLGGEGKFVEADETFTGGKAEEPRLQGSVAKGSRHGAGRARRQGAQLPRPGGSDCLDIEADHSRCDREGLPF